VNPPDGRTTARSAEERLGIYHHLSFRPFNAFSISHMLQKCGTVAVSAQVYKSFVHPPPGIMLGRSIATRCAAAA
jgi:hypothetical protein